MSLVSSATAKTLRLEDWPADAISFRRAALTWPRSRTRRRLTNAFVRGYVNSRRTRIDSKGVNLTYEENESRWKIATLGRPSLVNFRPRYRCNSH